MNRSSYQPGEHEAEGPPLSFNRSDIERRLGFPAGQYTSTGSLLAPLIAVLLTVAFYGVLALVPPTRFTAMFTQRGPVPYVIMPCSGSGGQPEVGQRLRRPMEFGIDMTRQVMRQNLGPAACLVVPTAAAERPVGVKLLIKQADAALHLATPAFFSRAFSSAVFRTFQFERVAAVTVMPLRASASRSVALGQ